MAAPLQSSEPPELTESSLPGWFRRFIDGNAKFIFDGNPAPHAGAIPFDTFQAGGFGHRGEDCTFETLSKEFGIRTARGELSRRSFTIRTSKIKNSAGSRVSAWIVL